MPTGHVTRVSAAIEHSADQEDLTKAVTMVTLLVQNQVAPAWNVLEHCSVRMRRNSCHGAWCPMSAWNTRHKVVRRFQAY